MMKRITSLLFLLFLTHASFSQTAEAATAKGLEEISYQKFRFSAQGGYGYRIAPLSEDTPPALKEYSNNLKSGYSFGLDAAYFLKPTWGFGLKYSRFGTEESMGNMQITYPDGSSANGTIADKISISFVGPSYISEYAFRNPKHIVFGAISLGYLSYFDEGKLADQAMEIKGATFGAAVDLGYDYAISRNLSIGAQASITGGSLNKLTVIDGTGERTVQLEEGSQENLSRMDISAGVKFKI